MQSISVTPATFNWRIGLTWMAGAFATWAVGIGFFFGSGWLLAPNLTGSLGTPLANVIAFSVGGIIFGAILGASAWVIFHHWASSLKAWVVLSAAGFGVGATIVAGMLAIARNDIAWLTGGAAVIGLTLGIAQWILLRRLPRAGWWIVATIIGVALAFWCAFALGGEGREGVALLSSGAAYAVITAVAAMGIFYGSDSTDEHVVN